MIMEFQSDGLRVIAANRDQGFDRVLLDSADAGLDSAILLSGIGSRGTQNSAATRQNSGHRRQIERHRHVVHHAAPTFEKTYELIVVVKDAFPYCSANHRI